MAAETHTRIPLNRERVLRAAVAFADQHGIDSLSMRKLGQELGVEAMSLYNHVTKKDDLLNGMLDTVLGEIDMSAGGTDWKSCMRHRILSARSRSGRLSGRKWKQPCPWRTASIDWSIDWRTTGSNSQIHNHP